MSIDSLTVSQAKTEIAQIIRDNPTCCGAISSYDEYDDDFACVYYTDQDGMPVSTEYGSDEPSHQELVTPVCLIGRWVEDFHPFLKQDEGFRDILVRNKGLFVLDPEEVPFSCDVLEFLKHVQIQQDNRIPWKDVKLDNFNG